MTHLNAGLRRRNSFLYFHIETLETLARLYMPFIRSGALCVPTTDHLSKGDKAFLLIRFMHEQLPSPVCATVIWVTQAQRSPDKYAAHIQTGIGLALRNDEGQQIRRKIEDYLSGHDRNVQQAGFCGGYVTKRLGETGI